MLAEPRPSGPCHPLRYASHGLIQPNAVTRKISVAMPITMPGTMIAT